MTGNQAIGAYPGGVRWGEFEAVHRLEALEPTLDCNSGGPMSRRRTLNLRASVLGDAGHASCPPLRSISIDFGNRNPVDAVQLRLAKLGFSSAEEARAVLLPPLPRCICVTPGYVEAVRFTALEPAELVRQALILGLSTAWLFDPTRPVIWTRASLNRRLVLYETQEFYS